jgi:drug/metabolite transporter (DMT)-like permease
MLWIVITVLAAPLQVARNVMQRGLIGDAGPWGATLVRFLFGMPFALAIFGVTAALTPYAAPHFSWRFAAAITVGAFCQIGATASLLMAMHRTGLAVATVMQQSSLPFSAAVGWLVLGDRLSAHATAGILLTTGGLVLLSWPRRDQMRGATIGALLGLLSGLAFAGALNGYRLAGMALEPRFPIYAGVAGVCIAQALQTSFLVTVLAIWRPSALRAVMSAWRQSLGAGFFGAAASACWFTALAMAPAGAVRAVGVVEMPIAAATGRRMFQERLTVRQLAGGLLAAVGVVMTALG